MSLSSHFFDLVPPSLLSELRLEPPAKVVDAFAGFLDREHVSGKGAESLHRLHRLEGNRLVQRKAIRGQLRQPVVVNTGEVYEMDQLKDAREPSSRRPIHEWALSLAELKEVVEAFLQVASPDDSVDLVADVEAEIQRAAQAMHLDRRAREEALKLLDRAMRTVEPALEELQELCKEARQQLVRLESEADRALLPDQPAAPQPGTAVSIEASMEEFLQRASQEPTAEADGRWPTATGPAHRHVLGRPDIELLRGLAAPARAAQSARAAAAAAGLVAKAGPSVQLGR